LFGHCLVIPELLLFNRDHPGRFTRVYRGDFYGWRERTNWFNPSNSKRKQLPYWQKLFKLWKVISRSSLKWRERVSCYWVLAQWLLERDTRRDLYQDVTHYPRKYLVRRFPKAKAAKNWLWRKKRALFAK
jgi:hypothetical protein